MTSLVDVAGLVELLRKPDGEVVVVDATVRLLPARHDGDHRSSSGAQEWSTDHVPGSIHLDLGGELADTASGLHYSHLGATELVAALAARGIGPDTTVVAYDRGDLMWASRLWWTLRWIGLDVRVLDGGLPAWQAAAPAVVARPARAPVPLWTPVPRDGHWVTLADVRAVVEGDAPGALVCGLGAEAFDGVVASRYTRRGHIPGSVNVPARDHVGADGLLRGTDELRAAYAAVSGAPIILYCGGGISATLNALALSEAGIEDVAVYDGSLEEWSADPTLPLLTA